MALEGRWCYLLLPHLCMVQQGTQVGIQDLHLLWYNLCTSVLFRVCILNIREGMTSHVQHPSLAQNMLVLWIDKIMYDLGWTKPTTYTHASTKPVFAWCRVLSIHRMAYPLGVGVAASSQTIRSLRLALRRFANTRPAKGTRV